MSDNSLKNSNISNADPHQMYNRIFDDKTDSFRMQLVGGQMPEIKLPDTFKMDLNTIEIPVIVKEIEIREIKVPEIVKQYEILKVEVPVIVKETEIKIIEIEKPIIITEIKVIEIEKPVIVKEIQVITEKVSEMPMIAKVCMVVQALAIVGILLMRVKSI